jgi:hypothetical protein
MPTRLTQIKAAALSRSVQGDRLLLMPRPRLVARSSEKLMPASLASQPGPFAVLSQTWGA